MQNWPVIKRLPAEIVGTVHEISLRIGLTDSCPDYDSRHPQQQQGQHSQVFVCLTWDTQTSFNPEIED